MALYDRDDPRAHQYLISTNALNDRISAKLEAEDKAADPLAFYWHRGVRSIRDRFALPFNFRVSPPSI